MSELKRWKKVKHYQKYKYTCVPTGYEWLIYYNNLEESVLGIDNFQDEFNLYPDSSFGSVKDKIVEKLTKKNDSINYFIKNVKVENFETTKEGWEKRIQKIDELLKKDIPCILPIPIQNIGWHIEPIVKLNKEEIWLLNENNNGNIRIDIMNIKFLRRYFLNEEGGQDLAWLDKP